jgi:hypothetical protein
MVDTHTRARARTHTQHGDYTLAISTPSDSNALQTYGTNQVVQFRVTDLFAPLITEG